MDHLGETYPPGPTRKFPNSLLEPCCRFRRQAPLRLLVIREAETQEFPFPWSRHRTLLPVHSQLELRREESRHAAHHSFAGPPTADVNVAIIRISCEPVSAPLRPRLATGVISPLRFAITSRPSRCEEDLHLLAVDPARHTKKRGATAF